MPDLALSTTVAALAALNLVQARGHRFRWGAAGLVLAALAASSLAIGAGTDRPRGLARLAVTAAVDSGFLTINAGLLLLAFAVIVALGRAPLVVAGTVLAAWLARDLFMVAAFPRALGIAALGAVAGLVVWAGASRVGAFFSRSRKAVSEGTLPGGTLPRVATWVAALLALTSGHAFVTLGAAIVALGAASIMAAGSSQVTKVAFVISLLGLGLAFALFITIVGPMPASYAGLRDGPFSNAAAVLLVGLILPAVFLASGIWPLRANGGLAPLLPVAAALAGRLVPAALGDGLLWWQPVVFPWLVLGLLHAVVRGPAVRALVPLGMTGCWAGTLPGGIGAGLLLGAALIAELVGRPGPGQGRAGWMGIFWLVPAVGGLFVLRAGLAVEVVYTVLMALIVAVAAAPPLGARDSVAPPPAPGHLSPSLEPGGRS